MEFEWDEKQRQATKVERHLDFATAYRFFDGWPFVTEATPRSDEDRWKTTCEIEGRSFTLVWLWRGANVRIVLFRRAHDDEERAYRSLHG